MTTILLARHGETDWNREGRFQGHADPPLNRTGRAQAVELALALEPEELAAVYTSPLRRALETAEIVAGTHGRDPIAVEDLREVDVGSWQGLTRTEVGERFPNQFARWLDFGQGWEDGETYEEMGRRVLAALLRLAAAHEDERLLVVTHGGPIRAAFAAVEGTSYAEARRRTGLIPNAFVAQVAVEDGALHRPAEGQAPLAGLPPPAPPPA